MKTSIRWHHLEVKVKAQMCRIKDFAVLLRSKIPPVKTSMKTLMYSPVRHSQHYIRESRS
jgi:hypothetical protein